MITKQKRLKQYFTPELIAKLILANTRLSDGMRIIEPSVGEGVFLNQIQQKISFYGIDIDKYVIDELSGEFSRRKNNLFLHGNALDKNSFNNIKENSFDLAIGNPPFSNQKDKVSDSEILKNYILGKGRNKQSVEILFLERFISLVKVGGSIRIILPINIFSNSDLQYVRDFIIANLDIEAVVTLPRNIFINTSAQTAVLFGKRKTRKLAASCETIPVAKIKIAYLKSLAEFESSADLSIDSLKNLTDISLKDASSRMDASFHIHRKNNSAIVKKSKYEFVKLDELAELNNGYAKYGSDKVKIYSDFDSGFVRLIKAKNLSEYGFKIKDNFFISKDEDIYKPSANVGIGDVLVVRVGMGCAGRSFYVSDKSHLGQIDDWIFVLRNAKINPAFLTFYLNSQIGRDFIAQHKQGTGTVSISKSKLKEVLVPVLSQNWQEFFEAELKSVYKNFALGQIETAKLKFTSMENKLLKLLNAA